MKGDKTRTKLSNTRQNAQNEENQLINLAMKQAKKMLQNGNAPAQIVTHFLKLATVKEQLENEKLRSDLDVARAKIEQIRAQQDVKQLYQEAIDAMNIYGGNASKEEEEEYEDDY